MAEAHGQGQYRHAVCFPSANSVRGYEFAMRWKVLGYIPFVLLDEGSPMLHPDVGIVTLFWAPPFPGYYKVANAIAARAFEGGADLCTFAADDMFPPIEANAHEIAERYFGHFPNGNGVMQATGDRQGIDHTGRPASERICGSPTFGRGWFENGYGGKGPFCDEYKSYYGDEDLYEVTKRDGLLWQNPAIKIDHAHWSWARMPMQDYHSRAQLNWHADKATFERRKANGFK